MKLYQDAGLPELPPFDPEFAEHQLSRTNELREQAPIAVGQFGAVVLRHADVSRLAMDRRLSGPQMMILDLAGIHDGPIRTRIGNILLFMEGEDHHRLRRLVSKAFTPRSVEALRPVARDVIRRLVNSVVIDRRCDAVPALCDLYPIPVICALVGIPADRWHDMSGWARSFLKSISLEAGQHRVEIERALAEMDGYLTELIEERRTQPGDDLLSSLIAVEEAGDRLSGEELLAVVSMLLVAGTDTTRNQLALLLHTFCQFPDSWAAIADDPSLVAGAVEEAVRWSPATAIIPRIAQEDIEVDGYIIPAGTLVTLSSMGANHDPAALPDAARFDIRRETPSGWHLLTFGGGIHHCLGAALARLELQEAVAELAPRLRSLRLDGVAERSAVFGSPIEGFVTLPIAWD